MQTITRSPKQQNKVSDRQTAPAARSSRCLAAQDVQKQSHTRAPLQRLQANQQADKQPKQAKQRIPTPRSTLNSFSSSSSASSPFFTSRSPAIQRGYVILRYIRAVYTRSRKCNRNVLRRSGYTQREYEGERRETKGTETEIERGTYRDADERWSHKLVVQNLRQRIEQVGLGAALQTQKVENS